MSEMPASGKPQATPRHAAPYAASREAARRRNGEFGTQPRTEDSTLRLDPVMAPQHPDDPDLDLSGYRPVAVSTPEGEWMVTPGVVDDAFRAAYEEGAPSLALACVIATEKDWDVVVTYAEEHYDIYDNCYDDGEPYQTTVTFARAQAPAEAGTFVVGSYGCDKPEAVGEEQWTAGGDVRCYSEIIERPSRSTRLNDLARSEGVTDNHLALADTFRAALLEASNIEPHGRSPQS